MNLQKNKTLASLSILFFFLFSVPVAANNSVYGYLEPVTLHPKETPINSIMSLPKNMVYQNQQFISLLL